MPTRHGVGSHFRVVLDREGPPALSGQASSLVIQIARFKSISDLAEQRHAHSDYATFSII
jgi:hypothetical protein